MTKRFQGSHDGLLKASIAVGVLVSIFSLGSAAGQLWQLAHADEMVATKAAAMRARSLPGSAVEQFEQTQHEQFAVMKRWLPAQAGTEGPYTIGAAAFALLAWLALQSARGYSRLARAAAGLAALRLLVGVVEWRMTTELAPLVRRMFTATMQQDLKGPGADFAKGLMRGIAGMMQSEMLTSGLAWTLALSGYFGYVALTLWNEPDEGAR